MAALAIIGLSSRSAARTVAAGDDWFVNWADVASVLRLDNGTLDSDGVVRRDGAGADDTLPKGHSVHQETAPLPPAVGRWLAGADTQKESRMKMKRIVTAMLAGCAAVVMSSASGLAAHTHEPQHAVTDKAKPGSGMAATDHARMAEREQMKADMKAADQRLDTLFAKMTAASATETSTATAAVVTDMVAQSRTMREGMKH